MRNSSSQSTTASTSPGAGGLLSVSASGTMPLGWRAVPVRAVRTGAVLNADGGSPAARVEPGPAAGGPTLRDRKLRPGFARLAGHLGPKSAADDVKRFISGAREGR